MSCGWKDNTFIVNGLMLYTCVVVYKCLWSVDVVVVSNMELAFNPKRPTMLPLSGASVILGNDSI